MALKSITTVINEALLLDMQDAFLDSEEGELAGVIQEGRLQEDPEKAHISILVHPGDPLHPGQWNDNILARRDHALDRKQFEGQTWEIGGKSVSWWRRGTVAFEFFGTLTGETRVEAERKAGVVRAKIHRAIDLSDRVPVCVDDFGENVIEIFAVTSYATEGGGEVNQFIWRGAVLWQALCGRSY